MIQPWGATRVVRPPTEKLGSCRKQIRNYSNTPQHNEDLPIGSYPQPQESIEQQPLFRDLDISDIFKL